MKPRAYTLWMCAAVFSVTACSGGGNTATTIPAAGQAFVRHDTGSGSSPIQHIVLIVQENRTFNNLFAKAGIPGATVQSYGYKGSKQFTLTPHALLNNVSLNHSYTGFLTAYDNGKMDAFNLVKGYQGRNEGNEPYQYVNPSTITPYITLAKTYALADRMFTTQGSESFTAHQDLIRGGTAITYNESLIDNLPYSQSVWGCDSPQGEKTSIITTSLKLEKDVGPFPCSNQFPYYPYQYNTLRDLLDAQSVTWKYYTPKIKTSGGIWSAFDAVYPVRHSAEWGTNVNWPSTNFFTDVSNGQLPAMSWVIPDGANSDHPGSSSDTGPSWVASIVNAIGGSQYWNSTAIIITWDDWGGFYDPIAPGCPKYGSCQPRDNQGGPGLRVPMIVVSPYARETSASSPGYVSYTVYEFGSIIQYIEDTFNLGRLGTTDETTNSMDDMFDYSQNPRTFSPIGTKYSRAYFMHQKPSNKPVDER